MCGDANCVFGPPLFLGPPIFGCPLVFPVVVDDDDAVSVEGVAGVDGPPELFELLVVRPGSVGAAMEVGHAAGEFAEFSVGDSDWFVEFEGVGEVVPVADGTGHFGSPLRCRYQAW